MRESRLIKDANAVYEGVDVFHSTVYDFEQSVIRDFDKNSPVLKGEMRYPFTKGSVSALFGWVLSARIKVKQENFETERLLTSYAEPMAVFASGYAELYIRRRLLIKPITICFKTTGMIRLARAAEMLYIRT